MRYRRTAMQLYVETVDLDAVHAILPLGIVDGIATTPELLAKAGGDPSKRLLELCALTNGAVMADVNSADPGVLVTEARRLMEIHERILVQIPCRSDTLAAMADLANDRIPVAAGGIFSVTQALLAAKAGARLIAVSVGPMDDAGGDGLSLLSAVITVLDQYELKTSVIAAGATHPGHIAEAARMGVDAATLPVELLDQLADHPFAADFRQQQLEKYRQAQN